MEFCGGIIIQTLPNAPPDVLPSAQELLSKKSILHNFVVKKQSLQDLLQDFVPEKITEGLARTQVCRGKGRD